MYSVFESVFKFFYRQKKSYSFRRLHHVTRRCCITYASFSGREQNIICFFFLQLLAPVVMSCTRHKSLSRPSAKIQKGATLIYINTEYLHKYCTRQFFTTRKKIVRKKFSSYYVFDLSIRYKIYKIQSCIFRKIILRCGYNNCLYFFINSL